MSWKRFWSQLRNALFRRSSLLSGERVMRTDQDGELYRIYVRSDSYEIAVFHSDLDEGYRRVWLIADTAEEIVNQGEERAQ